MTSDRELLLVDLSARLLYRVIGLYTWKNEKSYHRELTGSLYDELNSSWNSTEDSQFLPYLRPMSSMTKEERKDWNSTPRTIVEQIDWYNAHHFDYRGLIEKGLALKAPEGMYRKENNND